MLTLHVIDLRDAPRGQVPAQYGFAYDVKDGSSYVDLGHQEDRNGDDIKGNYNVVLPDGRRQVVNYYVNGYSGYVADVQYQGEAAYPAYPKSSYPAQPAYPKPAYPAYEPTYPKPSYEKVYPTTPYPKPAYEKAYPTTPYPKPAYEKAYPTTSYPKPSYEKSYPTTPYPTTPYPKAAYEKPYPTTPYPAYPKASYEPTYGKKVAYEPSYPTYQPAYPAYTTPSYERSYPTKPTYEPQYPSYPEKTTYAPYPASEASEVVEERAVAMEEPMDEATITKTMSKPLFRDEAEAMVRSETTQ